MTFFLIIYDKIYVRNDNIYVKMNSKQFLFHTTFALLEFDNFHDVLLTSPVT